MSVTIIRVAGVYYLGDKFIICKFYLKLKIKIT